MPTRASLLQMCMHIISSLDIMVLCACESVCSGFQDLDSNRLNCQKVRFPHNGIDIVHTICFLILSSAYFMCAKGGTVWVLQSYFSVSISTTVWGLHAGWMHFLKSIFIKALRPCLPSITERWISPDGLKTSLNDLYFGSTFINQDL